LRERVEQKSRWNVVRIFRGEAGAIAGIIQGGQSGQGLCYNDDDEQAGRPRRLRAARKVRAP